MDIQVTLSVADKRGQRILSTLFKQLKNNSHFSTYEIKLQQSTISQTG
jgi:hypothetical protein